MHTHTNTCVSLCLPPVLTNKLRTVEDMMNRKEEKLRGRSRDTHTAIQWLRENKALFTGNVYEPMMLVVRMANCYR